MTVITVTNDLNKGTGSLRNAIHKANSGDTIKFDASLANQTIVLNHHIGIAKSLTIDGSDAANLTISGNKTTGLFRFHQKNENLTVRNLTLSDSYDEEIQGGAIWATENSTVNIENTNFINNVSQGAALHGQKGSIITVANSTFDGNDGAKISDRPYSTGAISLFGFGSLTIKNSVFNNNKGFGGGALHVTTSDLIVEDSIFTGNDSTAGADKSFVSIPGGGGAIYLDSASVPNDPRFTKRPEQGESEPGQLIVRNSHFENNRAAGQGGAIMAWGYIQDRIVIEDTEIVNNEVIKNIDGMAQGGGLWLMGFVEMNNNVIANNKSADLGGGAYIWGEVPAKISDSDFSGNQASRGGAIYDGLWASQLEINSTNFDSNSATNQGGVIYRHNPSVPLSLQNSQFTNNKTNDITDYRWGDLASVSFDRDLPDIRYGTYSNDSIVGKDGDSYLIGLDRDDTLMGNGGNDYLDGGANNDILFGGVGNDTLVGGNGINYIVGGDGNDIFSGGYGQDLMEGGNGADKYILGDENRIFYTDHGWYDRAIIKDFQPGQDTIQLKGKVSDYTIKPVTSQGISGTGILYNNEMIAIIGNMTPDRFSLNADYIEVVGKV
jgi:predicted outer membrane repeat protein